MELEQFSFTDLSERIRGQDGERIARQALERLRALRALAAAQANEGVQPEEFERLRVLFDTLSAAERVMLALVQLRGGDARSMDV